MEKIVSFYFFLYFCTYTKNICNINNKLIIQKCSEKFSVLLEISNKFEIKKILNYVPMLLTYQHKREDGICNSDVDLIFLLPVIYVVTKMGSNRISRKIILSKIEN